MCPSDNTTIYHHERRKSSQKLSATTCPHLNTTPLPESLSTWLRKLYPQHAWMDSKLFSIVDPCRGYEVYVLIRKFTATLCLKYIKQHLMIRMLVAFKTDKRIVLPKGAQHLEIPRSSCRIWGLTAIPMLRMLRLLQHPRFTVQLKAFVQCSRLLDLTCSVGKTMVKPCKICNF